MARFTVFLDRHYYCLVRYYCLLVRYYCLLVRYYYLLVRNNSGLVGRFKGRRHNESAWLLFGSGLL